MGDGVEHDSCTDRYIRSPILNAHCPLAQCPVRDVPPSPGPFPVKGQAWARTNQEMPSKE